MTRTIKYREITKYSNNLKPWAIVTNKTDLHYISMFTAILSFVVSTFKVMVQLHLLNTFGG